MQNHTAIHRAKIAIFPPKKAEKVHVVVKCLYKLRVIISLDENFANLVVAAACPALS